MKDIFLKKKINDDEQSECPEQDEKLSLEQSANIFSNIQALGLIAFVVALIPYSIFVLITAFNKSLMYASFLNVNYYVLCGISIFLLVLLPETIFFRIKYLVQNKIKVDIKSLIPLFILFLALIYTTISTFALGATKKTIIGCDYNKEGLITVFMYTLFFLSALFTTNPKMRKIVIITLIGVSVTTNLVLIVLKAVNIGATNDLLSAKVVHSFFNNSNHWGYYATTTAILAACGVVYSKETAYSILYSIALAIILVALLVSHCFGSNIAFLMGLLFITVTYFLTGHKYSPKLILMFGVALAAFSVSELTKFSTIVSEYVDFGHDMNDVIVSGSHSQEGLSAGSGRMKLWLTALGVMRDYPFIGKGLDVYYSEIYPADMPHNEYLQIGSGVGIPVLVLYLVAILYAFFYALAKRKKLSTLGLVSLAASFTYCVSAFFGNTFHYTYPYFLLLFGFSMRELINIEEPLPQLDLDVDAINAK